MVGHPVHLSARQWEICEQSRAEKSKVRINLGVTSIQVAIESARHKGSLEDRRDSHTWRRA